MLILAASIALGVAIVLWSMGSSYTPLYTGLSNQDSANVITELQQNGIPYKIDNVSGNVMVPSNDMRQIRIQLANEGLPRSTGQGFDILNEDQSLGTSNFIEQARYNHALELELTRTITQIQGVRDARVHLSIPRQNSFIRNSRKSSASVMIDIAGAQHPGDTQLSGILHLVASSVAGLEPEQVSIVDQRGNLLSDRDGAEFGNSTEAMRFTRSIEEDYSNRIIDLLTPIVGSGNVKAQVSANIDFTAMETTQEFYNPETQVIRSEQLQEESADLNSNSASVEPGTVSPLPPADQATDDGALTSSDNNRQTRTSSMRNYEIDRSVSHTRTVPGAIDQLSVAVLVDLNANSLVGGAEGEETATEVTPVSPEEIQGRIDRFTQLVKDAVGFNEARGDTVSVINEAFFVAELPEIAETPMWQQSWFISTLKQVGAGLVVLVLIFGVLRPALKSVVSGQASAGRITPALPGSATAEDFPDDQVHLSGNSPEQGAVLAAGNAPAISYDDNLARAQTLVMQEPNRAARMIQHWLENE